MARNVNYHQNKPVAYICIGLGLLAFFFAIGPLMFPLVLLATSWFLINYGLRLLGKPTLGMMLNSIWIWRYWRW